MSENKVNESKKDGTLEKYAIVKSQEGNVIIIKNLSIRISRRYKCETAEY